MSFLNETSTEDSYFQSIKLILRKTSFEFRRARFKQVDIEAQFSQVIRLIPFCRNCKT